MKKISTMRMFIEYILIVLALYLIVSGIIAMVGGWTYRSILLCEEQLIPIVFFYWWPPIFRMYDISKHNERVEDNEPIYNRTMHII